MEVNSGEDHQYAESSEWFVKYLNRQGDWLEKTRGNLMVAATVIAGMSFQVMVSPPGGVWQSDNCSSGDQSGTSSVCKAKAGTSVLEHDSSKRRLYLGMVISSTVSFSASMSLILLVISGLRLRRSRETNFVVVLIIFRGEEDRWITETIGNGIESVTTPTTATTGQDLLNDEIVSEHLTRNIQFFNLESQRKVTESYVVVIGLGGVGSHAASMLLRSGVGKLLLVDFDQVFYAVTFTFHYMDIHTVCFQLNFLHYNLPMLSLSSLNRYAVATREDVGIPKATCLKNHFSLIFPECCVEAKVMLYDSSSEEEILSGNLDFVLDCIDNSDTKVALLAACVKRGLKFCLQLLQVLQLIQQESEWQSK
ncbi:unnamed protein product [Microthlaspi erraticum]|uniref:THIF-type NAD/FAD binding fold domain-containing protein n=1 Tax=Microthlaspi erraticum TaxID=1685480 RepID=A0A6D2J407_9BRAS|nr:unnamed protein product [Microthlaspi erraticum]